MADPRMEVRKITSQHAEKFAQHLKKSGLAVDTHNRKIKRLRKIFATLSEFRDGENPFRTTLFRREREPLVFAWPGTSKGYSRHSRNPSALNDSGN